VKQLSCHTPPPESLKSLTALCDRFQSSVSKQRKQGENLIIGLEDFFWLAIAGRNLPFFNKFQLTCVSAMVELAI
jgi:hypothetical protein